MEDYRLEQTGAEVQEILNTATPQSELTDEVTRATEAEQQLQSNIDTEERDREDADTLLQQNIDAEADRAGAAEEALDGRVADIEGMIPAAASDQNKLADVDFVNSSIATATATFRGSFNLVSDLHLGIGATHEQIAFNLGNAISEADNNDYCYVQIPTSAETPTQIASVERYKFTTGGWSYEYTINNSGFTAAQWAAINSGITSGLVGKLGDLPTATELATLLAGKQNVLTFDNVPTQGSSNPVKSGGVYSAIDDEKGARVNNVNTLQGEIDGIEGKIPAAATSENKLVDEAKMNSAIATATATFRGSYNLVTDLGLAVTASHEQIAAALAGAISTSDKNDYAFVMIPTSAETPTQIASVERYKNNGEGWGFEYALNNSGFTAAQWAALNSGITSGLVSKLGDLPTATELTTLLAGKQDTLTFDNVPTQDSANPVKSGGVYTATKNLSDAIEAILLLIPSAASSLNKLVDNELLNSSIATATATFRGTYNLVSDLHLGIDASHAQIATMLGSVAPLSDNNDYCFVQIPTSVTEPTQIAQTDRYKYSGSEWFFEYTLNNSGFTAAQWAAINSGITAGLVGDIEDLETLIPEEASAQNQLADKVYVLAQIIANIPAFKGQFETLLELQSVTGAKSGDLGIVRTKDSDGMDVFTFYQYLNSQWNAYYTLSHHPQTKPATTGTTGAYPYNGMGKIELPMNMVSDVNTLTQAMLAQTNTIYVIKYDFVLGEDITIPANCVLEFEGGSIKAGAGTSVSYTSLFINADDNACIFIDVSLTIVDSNSYLSNPYISVGWFKSSNATVDDEAESVKLAMTAVYYGKELRFISNKEYKISSLGRFKTVCDINLNNATIRLVGNNEDYLINIISDSSWTAVYKHSRIRNGRIIGYESSTRSDNNEYENIIVLGESSGPDLINYRVSDIKFYRITATNSIIRSLYCYGITIEDCDFHYCYANKGIEFYGGKPSSGGNYYNLGCTVQNCDLSPSCISDGFFLSSSSVTIQNSIMEGFTGAAVHVADVQKNPASKGYYWINNCHMEQNHIDFKLEGNNYGSNMTRIQNNRCSDADIFAEVSYGAQALFQDNEVISSGGIIAADTITPSARYNLVSNYNEFSKKSSDQRNYVGLFEENLASKVRSYWNFTIPSGETNRRVFAGIGSVYFDTNLGNNGKPIWYAGNNIWVDATGTPV